MSKSELLSKLGELRKDLIKQNAQIAVGTVPKSPGMVRNMKKLVAKIMFALKEERSKDSKEVTKKDE